MLPWGGSESGTWPCTPSALGPTVRGHREGGADPAGDKGPDPLPPSHQGTILLSLPLLVSAPSFTAFVTIFNPSALALLLTLVLTKESLRCCGLEFSSGLIL
ncbi:hypothetical protein E2C01_063776 [Portunus trituberculatus]|uniref:Uncharacterized protein n=1 Tax=Portunus trituberculatus TaxID=210409 RepID=A0A5B7HJY6_PORTR|nr:hypothetical protein [Portunus trituberculatus]